MTDDKTKARHERYSHDIFGSDSHPYSGMRENDEGDFVSHEDYLALQSELSEVRDFLRLEIAGHNATQDELERVMKERDGLRSTLEFLRDNRMHDSRVTELCREALKEIK